MKTENLKFSLVKNAPKTLQNTGGIIFPCAMTQGVESMKLSTQ